MPPRPLWFAVAGDAIVGRVIRGKSSGILSSLTRPGADLGKLHRSHARAYVSAALVAGLIAGCSHGPDSRSTDACTTECVGDGGSNDAAVEPGGDGGEPARDGGVGDASVPPDGGHAIGFCPFAGLDAPGRARELEGEHASFAQALLSHSDGTSWLLWRSYVDPSFAVRSLRLDHFDADGVFVRSSSLANLEPNGLFLDLAGSPVAFRNRCGEGAQHICFYADATSEPAEIVWKVLPRTTTVMELDWNGELVESRAQTFDRRLLNSVVSSPAGHHALTQQGACELHQLDEHFVAKWSLELLPPVIPPEVPLDAPFEELLRANKLASQTSTPPVVVDDGVVLAIAASRGSIAALNQARNLSLALPDEPTCADIVVVWIASDGQAVRYWSIPTPVCELLPQLGVSGQHVIVASTVSVAKAPEPNDTSQLDISVGTLDRSSGVTGSRILDFGEDDIVHAVARCGARLCVAGVTGARSVDTGSTITFGSGFLLPLAPDGEPHDMVRLGSARHSEILQLAPSAQSLLFFGSFDGPITHTADQDRWLGYNRVLLGSIALD
jgi:hypothetical protein